MSNVPLKPARRGALTLVADRRDAVRHARNDQAPAAPDAALPPGWFEEWIGYVGDCADLTSSPSLSPKRSR